MEVNVLTPLHLEYVWSKRWKKREKILISGREKIGEEEFN